MNDTDYVQVAYLAGLRDGAEHWGEPIEKALLTAYDNALDLFDGDDACNPDDEESDMITGAYIGGFLGARWRSNPMNNV